MTGSEAWAVLIENLADLVQLRREADPECRGYTDDDLEAEVIIFQALKKFDRDKKEGSESKCRAKNLNMK